MSETNFNNQDSSKNTKNAGLNFWKAWLLKNQDYVWYLAALVVGFYLVWKTLIVLLDVAGCMLGLFLIIFSAQRMGILRLIPGLNWLLRKSGLAI